MKFLPYSKGVKCPYEISKLGNESNRYGTTKNDQPPKTTKQLASRSAEWKDD